MVQWLIIHLYIHRTSVLKHLKLYKLTFFFFKLTLHIGKCKTALNIHGESLSDSQVSSSTVSSTSLKKGSVTWPWTADVALFFFFLIKCSTSSTVTVSRNSFFCSAIWETTKKIIINRDHKLQLWHSFRTVTSFLIVVKRKRDVCIGSYGVKLNFKNLFPGSIRLLARLLQHAATIRCTVYKDA